VIVIQVSHLANPSPDDSCLLQLLAHGEREHYDGQINKKGC